MNLGNSTCAHDPDLGAIAPLVFIAAAQLVCGLSVKGTALIYFVGPAAGFSLIVALVLISSIVRFERRQQAGERREQ